jgi:hypothetical protein
MSLFDDASLVYIPTGYKPTKNYSGKPSTGGADMTFSRASGATRVNSRGLVEKVRTNYILQSNSFDTTWATTDASVTSGQSGYDGTSNAWLLNVTGGTAGQRIDQPIVLGGLNTYSVYLKAGTVNWVALRNTGSIGAIVWFNLANGTKGANPNSALNYTITSVGSGWYRCRLTLNSTTDRVYIYPATADDFAGLNCTSGDNILIQAAQLEAGDIATNYIETTSAAVSVGPVNDEPRLTYDPVNPTAPSLLMEPQRTNVLLSSENWTTNWGGANRLVTANDIISPDGYQNANKLAAVGGGAYYSQVRTTASGANTFSVFLKYGNKPVQALYAYSSGIYFAQAYFNIQTGVVSFVASGTATMEDYGNGWYRCSISGTAATSTIEIGLDGIGLTDYSYAWGAQLEAGTYATSYLNTLGAAVTRLADSASKTGIGSLLSASEYTLYWEGTHIPTGQYNSFMTIYKASDLNSSARFYRNNTNNEIRAAIFDSVSGLSLDLGSGVTTQTAKCALRVKAGDYALYVNGNLVNSNTNALAPSSNLDAVNLQYFDSSQSFDQKTGQVLFFPTRLSNATLATLTSL